MQSQPGKIAVVTGANRGIGLEIARQLSEKGVRTILTGRKWQAVHDVAESLRTCGLDAHSMELDVTRPESVSKAAAEVERAYGRLDILVNNAAIRVEQYGKQPSEQPLEQWRETFETNLFGVVSVTKAFLPLIRRSAAGRIVNVSSLLGSISTHSDPTSYAYSPMFKSLPGYSASKSAVNSWTVHLAFELRDTPIKVNAVHPGYTRTGMNDGAGDQDAAAGATTSVRMALLDADGPSGSYACMDGILPW